MIRLQRRMNMPPCPTPGLTPEHIHLEEAIRGRAARKMRAQLRRMEPVVVLTPRWSAPQAFMEALAMDLAVSEPTVSCRSTSFRPLKGRSNTEGWRYTLGLLARLGAPRGEDVRAPSPVSRMGFRNAVVNALETANERTRCPVALLAHGAEYLPVGVLEDLTRAWDRFSMSTSERRVTLLLASSVDAPSLDLPGATRMSLTDFGEAEAAAALIGLMGPTSRQQLQAAARFTGGVPVLVTALGTGARALGAMPHSRSGLIRCLGPLADEVRGAVDIVVADSSVAERLDALRCEESLAIEPALDRHLITAGLARYVRSVGTPRVALRAPVIGELLG